jgi:hypothetical protein
VFRITGAKHRHVLLIGVLHLEALADFHILLQLACLGHSESAGAKFSTAGQHKGKFSHAD